MKNIYMDYAATTPVDKEVLKEMLPYFDKVYGNASSIHNFGIDSFNAVEEARERIGKLINGSSEEIVITSGGTESDNLAIKGVAFKYKKNLNTKGYQIITSQVEHPAVLETCKYLEKLGFKVKYLPVDKYGLINIEDLKKAISKDTFLISIMYANNEIGTIEPMEEIGKITKEHDILFHTDAVQAVCKAPIDIKKFNIDLLSISAHKIYGPKGCGALFVKKGTKIQTIQHGGGHEYGLRSSTHNTPGIVGLGKACELGRIRLEDDAAHMQKLRDKLIDNILNNVEESYLNGHPQKRLVNNAHLRFTGIEGESLNMMLNDKGIAAATGSACSSKKLKASHVLLAIGLKPEEAHGSLRLSLGRMSNDDEISYVTDVLPDVVNKLRKMSPLWNR